MTRWQANGVIVFVALIWGTTFVVQQTGMDNIGPQYFTGVRFLLGTLVVLPFALREWRNMKREGRTLSRANKLGLIFTGVSNKAPLVGMAGRDDVCFRHLSSEWW